MQRFDLAFVAHRTPTRMRIRIPGRRGDDAFFDGLKRQLLDWRGVLEVETSSITCGIVINHARDCEWSRRRLAQLGLICATEPHRHESLRNPPPAAGGPCRRESIAVIDLAAVIVQAGSALLRAQAGAALTRYVAERLIGSALASSVTAKPE
jgi:hypothetical protein